MFSSGACVAETFDTAPLEYFDNFVMWCDDGDCGDYPYFSDGGYDGYTDDF